MEDAQAAMLVEFVSTDPLVLLAIIVTIIAASVVQAATGVGFGLIAAPILVLIDPSYVPGSILMLGLVVTSSATLRELNRVNLPLLAAGLVGRMPGALTGAVLAAALAPAYFGIVFGALILLAVLFSVVGPRFSPNRTNIFIAGLISGVMGTLTSVGAPPMAIAMQNAPGPEMRATTSAFLFFGAVISIVSLACFGQFGLVDVYRALTLIPLALIGFFLSRWLVFRTELDRWLRPSILALCIAMSVLLLTNSIADLNVF